MLSPLFANSSQLDSFRYGNEDYIMMTFFFHSPPKQTNTWRPPIEFMPVATIIIPRQAYKAIVTKFLGYMSRQDEPLPPNSNPNQIKPDELNPNKWDDKPKEN